jgi:hypothetical protein
MGQPEWDRQYKTARTEPTNRTDSTGMPAQDYQHRTAKIREPGQDKKETKAEKTARTGQLNRTDRSIQPEQDSQTRTSRTGQADR